MDLPFLYCFNEVVPVFVACCFNPYSNGSSFFMCKKRYNTYQDSRVSILILMDLPFLFTITKIICQLLFVSILILMDLPFLSSISDSVKLILLVSILILMDLPFLSDYVAFVLPGDM